MADITAIGSASSKHSPVFVQEPDEDVRNRTEIFRFPNNRGLSVVYAGGNFIDDLLGIDNSTVSIVPCVWQSSDADNMDWYFDSSPLNGVVRVNELDAVLDGRAGLAA